MGIPKDLGKEEINTCGIHVSIHDKYYARELSS